MITGFRIKMQKSVKDFCIFSGMTCADAPPTRGYAHTEILTDDLSLHIFELPGIERHIKAKKRDELAEWLYFFNHAHEEGEETMKEHYKNPMINKAMHKLVFLSADEKMRELADRRERALRDEAMFLNEAKTKGKQEVIINLLKMNVLTIDQIAETAGLEIKRIEKLRQEI